MSSVEERERVVVIRREDSTLADLIRILIAVLLPPLAVFLEVGFRGHFWLNVLLCLLGWLPGVVHAIYIIGRF